MKSFLRVAGRLAGVAVLTLFLVGMAQAQNDTITPDPYQKSKEPVYLTPQADHALLYIARPEYVRVFGLSDFKVFVDDKAAGWLPQRTYLAVQVEPGRRLVWGPSRPSAFEVQRFDFQAGKTYLLVLAERYKMIYTGNGSQRVLDATWWIERNPEEIRSLVTDGKLQYVVTLDDEVVALNKEAVKKYAKTNGDTRDPGDFPLPATFEKVWYRPAKRGFSLKPYEASGTLTINRQTIEYTSDKTNMVIPMKDVQWVSFGPIPGNRTLGDSGEWDIIRFVKDGSVETIAFRDGRHLNFTGPDTTRIFQALRAAAPPKPESSAEASAQVPADSSAQPSAADESQPEVSAAAPAAGSQSASSSGPQPAAVTPSSASVSAIVTAREGSFGSPGLQRDTLRMISMLDNAEPPDCNGVRRVLKMEITKEPVGVKIKHNRAVSGQWEERWTIDRCGTQRAYSITYRNDIRGEVDFGAGMIRTLGSQALQDDTLKVISALDGPVAPDCKTERRVFTTEVTRLPAGVKVEANRMVAGWWQERWTIHRCQAQVAYDVTFRADGRGGTDISPKAVMEQEKKTDTSTPPPPPPQPAAGENPPPAASPSQPPALGALPDGFVLFEGRKDQFTIAIPKDWTVYDQARMLEALGTQRSKNGMFNVVIFYRSSDPPQDVMSVETMRKIETGEAPSFFVQKAPAGKEMSCGGFSEKAAKQVVKLVGSDSTFSKGATVMEAPHAEPSPVAGCKGIRIRGSGQAAGSSATTIEDVYAASDGVVLYLFSLRNPADKFDQNDPVFQKAVATARLSAAK